MRKIVFLLALGIAAINAYSQDKQIGISSGFVAASEQEYSIEMVYHKITGERISQKILNQLVDNNPKLYLEQVYDKNGKVIRYYYNPKNQKESIFPNPNSIASSGGVFPLFKFKTIEGNYLELEKLKGKLVLIRFEIYCNDFRFKKHEIKALDEKINILENSGNIKAIIVFGCDKNEIKKGFTLKNSNFELVADGTKFFEKYQINRYPMTALIDQNGNLIDYFKYSEDIVFEDYLEN